MTREDFINWLDRPLTDSDYKIIDYILEAINQHDKNVDIIMELTKKLDDIQKILLDNKSNIMNNIKENEEKIEVLDV